MSHLHSILQAAFVVAASVAIIWFAENIINAVERFVSFITRNAPSRRMRNIDKAVQLIVESYSATFENLSSCKEREEFLFYSGLANPQDAWSVTSRYVTHFYNLNNVAQEDRNTILLFNDGVSINDLLNNKTIQS